MPRDNPARCFSPQTGICVKAHKPVETAVAFPVFPVLTALADPTRLAVLRLLWDGDEHCACALMPRLAVTQSRVSRHMAALKAAGLVVDRRDRQWVRYRIPADLPPEIRALVAAALDAEQAAPDTRESTGKSPARSRAKHPAGSQPAEPPAERRAP